MVWASRFRVCNSFLGMLLMYDKWIARSSSSNQTHFLYLIWSVGAGLLHQTAQNDQAYHDGDSQLNTGVSHTLTLAEMLFFVCLLEQAQQINRSGWQKRFRQELCQGLQKISAPDWLKNRLRVRVVGEDSLLQKKILPGRGYGTDFMEESALSVKLEGWYQGLFCRDLYLDKHVTVISYAMFTYANIQQKLVIRSAIKSIEENAFYHATLPTVLQIRGMEEGNDNGLSIARSAFAYTEGLAYLHITHKDSCAISTQAFWHTQDLQCLVIDATDFVNLDEDALSSCPKLRWLDIRGQYLRVDPNRLGVSVCPKLEVIRLPKIASIYYINLSSFTTLPGLKKLILADSDYENLTWQTKLPNDSALTILSHSQCQEQAKQLMATQRAEWMGEDAEKTYLFSKEDAERAIVFGMPLSWVFYGRKAEFAYRFNLARKLSLFQAPPHWHQYQGIYGESLIGQGFFSRKDACMLHEALCLSKKKYAKQRQYPNCGDPLYNCASVWDLLKRSTTKKQLDIRRK